MVVGLAVGIGLVFDAVRDPLVGYLSDNTKSRLGGCSRTQPGLVSMKEKANPRFFRLLSKQFRNALVCPGQVVGGLRWGK